MPLGQGNPRLPCVLNARPKGFLCKFALQFLALEEQALEIAKTTRTLIGTIAMRQSSTTSEGKSLDRLTIDTIRMLAIDAVQNANSGHPGTPLALAPIAYTLWAKFLRYDPAAANWPNRDRFVMSNGHASMLLYSLLHLADVEELDANGGKTGNRAVTMEDIRQFRQLNSKTPGHPEYRMTTGVETTTGPLGQGCGNSVGMAIAERWLAARYNREGFRIFDHDVYAFCGDGDMMEGVSGEAASLAGHIRLANLCWIYDNNTITIEGHTKLAFSEDVAVRFRGYGWHTIIVDDANDVESFAAAITKFKATTDRPTIVLVRSVIGYGSPKADSEKAHGSPLGSDAVKATKQFYGWPTDKQFYVPDGVADYFSGSMKRRSQPLRSAWEASVRSYGEKYPDLATELHMICRAIFPTTGRKEFRAFPPTPRALPVGTLAARSRTQSALPCPGWSEDLRISRLRRRRSSRLTRLGLSNLRITAEETCISGYESMPWGRSLTE